MVTASVSAHVLTLDEEGLKQKAAEYRKRAEELYKEGNIDGAIDLLKLASQYWPCDGVAQRLNKLILKRDQAKYKKH